MNSLPTGLTLRNFRRVGRSLQSIDAFNIGDVVLEDVPLLEWRAESINWPSEIPDLTTAELLAPRAHISGLPQGPTLQVPSFLIAAATEYCTPSNATATKMTNIARQWVLDMHVPELPIGGAYADANLFCERLSQRLLSSSKFMARVGRAEEEEEVRREEDPGLPCMWFQPWSLLHVMLAAKVNAHRGPTGTWRMYRYGSKLAHSCDPNCGYIAQRSAFVAIRPIKPGTLITFSYLGGPPLFHPAVLRQQRLLASHLFVCQCCRCRGEDVARSFPCASCHVGTILRSTSTMLDGEDDLSPDNVGWACSRCEYTAADSDPYVARLLEREAALWRDTMTDMGEAAHPYKLHELFMCLNQCVDCEPMQHASIDASTTDAMVHQATVPPGMPLLGRHCWLYGLLMLHFGRYFTTIGKATADIKTLGLAARCLCAGIAIQARVTGELSMLTVSSTTQLAEVYRMLALVRDMSHVPEHELASSICRTVAGSLRVSSLRFASNNKGPPSSSLALPKTSSEWLTTVLSIAEAMRTTTDRADGRWRIEEKKLQFLTFLLGDVENESLLSQPIETTAESFDCDCQAIEREILARVQELR